MSPVGATSWDGLVLEGAALDTIAGADGAIVEVGRADLRAEVGPDRTLRSLHPLFGGAEALIGAPVASGFRNVLAVAVGEGLDRGSPLYLLLDDLPVATLISGYADLYAGRLPAVSGKEILRRQADICAGWAGEGTMLTLITAHDAMPTPVGPEAPSWDGTDTRVWPGLAPLAAGAMRRRRLLEVFQDGPARLGVRATFRDTHRGPDGMERVLHEYALAAVMDPATRVFTECEAEPRVLPWPECPSAAASARRIVGRRSSEVGDFVRKSLKGTSTCTHLNDLLRSLGQAEPLSQLLAPAGFPGKG